MRLSSRLALLILLASVLLLSACSQDDPYANEPEQKKQMLAQQRALFDRHFAQWQASPLQNYTFTRSIECKCQEQRDLVISVVEGRVADAYYLNQGTENEATSKEKAKKFSTINDFFHMIDFAIKHHYDHVEASYDSDYGYPTAMNFVVNNQAKSDGVNYRIHDFNIRYTISFPPITAQPSTTNSEIQQPVTKPKTSAKPENKAD